MGVLTTVKKEEIESFLRKRNLGGLDSFVVAFKHNGFVKGLLKLLASNLWYTLDGTTICIIAATDDYLLAINPSWRLSSSLDTLPDDRVQRMPWDQVEDFSIESDWRASTISWIYEGKKHAWTVDVRNPGVWHFNPEHVKKLEQYSSRR